MGILLFSSIKHELNHYKMGVISMKAEDGIYDGSERPDWMGDVMTAMTSWALSKGGLLFIQLTQ